MRWPTPSPDIDVISLSGTTPGLTAMDEDGDALYPAILMLDQRSHQQARAIIDTVGLDHLLATTANMPVAGGCSLAGILWLRDNVPEVFRKTCKFGHSNTYFAHWLTGQYAIDPSSASLTGLYNTVRNDCTWNTDLVRTFGLSLDQLPPACPRLPQRRHRPPRARPRAWFREGAAGPDRRQRRRAGRLFRRRPRARRDRQRQRHVRDQPRLPARNACRRPTTTSAPTSCRTAG